MLEPKPRNSRAMWIVGGVVLLLVFGCLSSVAVGTLAMRWFTVDSASVMSEPVPTPRVVDVAAPRAPAPTRPPQIVIATPEGGMDYETAVLENIYNQVNGSVVNVTVLSRAHSALNERQLPPNVDPDQLLPFSSGSGFVWDNEGHIVTNNHVVDGADEVQITFSDGTVAIAEIVGTDPDSDIAVLRIDPTGYTIIPVQLGKMEDIHVGMRVAAIGNPFGLEGTLTSGIVSAIGRSIPARGNFSIPDSIQTDAAINPGNSGGPLLNERGEVIGINAQIRSEDRSNSGIGFAIPVNVVERVVPAIIAGGSYAHSYMGVSGGTLSPVCADDLGLPHELRGAIVNQVLPNSPAARAGLRGGDDESGTRYPGICPIQRGGDVIVAINGQPVTRFDDVLSYLQRETSPGDTVVLTLWRDGQTVEIDLTLDARPSTS